LHELPISAFVKWATDLSKQVKNETDVFYQERSDIEEFYCSGNQAYAFPSGIILFYVCEELLERMIGRLNRLTSVHS
jgi:hypothetical protein